MFKALVLFIGLTATSHAYTLNLPNLDFDMAERAIESSEAVQNAADNLGMDIVDVYKVGKKTYRVVFSGGCDITAKFGKGSKVSIVPDSFFCN